MYGKHFSSIILISIIVTTCVAQEEIPYRKMDYYSWQEFARLVPEKIETVILAVGTQEAHGVVANGTDALVPDRLAEMIAPEVNGLVAPVIPYGRTTSLAAYPGGFEISEETFTSYCHEVVSGLAECGFKNIIIINGHGPNRAPLNLVAAKVSSAKRVRVLVIDWWSYCSDVTKEIWGEDEDGGHAGLNENAAVLALDPRFGRDDLYKPEMAVVNNKAYSTYPAAGTILLYSKGKGYPDFDRDKAIKYLQRVSEELAGLVNTTVSNWDNAGLYR